MHSAVIKMAAHSLVLFKLLLNQKKTKKLTSLSFTRDRMCRRGHEKREEQENILYCGPHDGDTSSP